MATKIYGVDKGADYSTVTEGVGSATTKGLEMTVDLAKFATKTELILAAEQLIRYITRDAGIPN